MATHRLISIIVIPASLGCLGGFLIGWYGPSKTRLQQAKPQVQDKAKALVESLRTIDCYRRIDKPTVRSLTKLNEPRIDGPLYLAEISPGEYDKQPANDTALVVFPYEGGSPTVLCVYRNDKPTVENLVYLGREYWWNLRLNWIGDEKPLSFDTVIKPTPD